MTELDELVDSMGEDTIISIGSAQCFFFIGTKAEYVTDIDSISNKYLQELVRLAHKYTRLAKGKYAMLRKLAWQGKKPAPEQCGAIGHMLRLSLDNTASAAQFTPLRARKVVDYYPGIEEGTEKIIVEGDEAGEYWLREEYQAARKKKC